MHDSSATSGSHTFGRLIPPSIATIAERVIGLTLVGLAFWIVWTTVRTRRLATPVASWERLKIGGGAPPILTRHGWLALYHGVSEVTSPPGSAPKLRYSAGVMVLSAEAPEVIRYRSPEPVLTPELLQEREGIVANVVFPTAIDRRDDLGSPDRFDVYYGMTDSRIGVARLVIPECLDAAAAKEDSIRDPRTPIVRHQ